MKDLQQEVKSFQAGFSTVLLSTVSAEGQPGASYAPFVFDQTAAICIFTSELAAHTRNLLTRPTAALMFIENEEAAKNPFARKRLTLQCTAVEIPVNSDAGAQILDKMESVFGKTVQLLRSLPDFHIFKFDVTGGSYVKGFGQAYALQGNELEVLNLRGGSSG